MTCKDCKQWKTCNSSAKSDRYSDDGDSWANWCEEFVSRFKDKTVRWGEYRITQSGYNLHTMIIKGNQFVMHAQTTKPLTRLELYRQLKRYLNFSKELFGKIYEDEG